MKLERLETLNLISTKNLIVNEVLKGLDKKFYYNIYELEINLSLVLFTLLGNTELHKEMAKEDIDWISFINDNYKLIEELKDGDYRETYNEIFREIITGAQEKVKYNMSIASLLENIGEIFTEENMKKLSETIGNLKVEEK